VNRVGRERRDHAFLPEDDGLDGMVVGQHGDQDVAAARRARLVDDPGTRGDQRLGFGAGPIVEGDMMTGL
jgi:hypothetical protein